MLRSIINFETSLNTAVGVSIDVLGSSIVSISYCVLKKKRGILTILKTGKGINSIDQLKTEIDVYLKAGVRVHVNIKGKGVVGKVPDNSNNNNNIKNVHEFFPFLNSDEILLQSYQSDDFSIVFVARDKIISEFSQIFENYNTLSGISLGPLALVNLMPLIDCDTIHVDGYIVSLENNKVLEIEYDYNSSVGKSLLVGGVMLEPEVLLAYASAFSIFFPSIVQSMSHPLLDSGVSQFKARRQLFTVVKMSLIIVFALLVANSFLYFWLSSRINLLNINYRQSYGKKVEENRLIAKSNTAFQLFDKLGWSSNIVPLYYADQLAQTVTSEIQLLELEIGVANKEKVRTDQQFFFDPQQIRVKGLVENPVYLQEWTYFLEKIPWISNISDQIYYTDARYSKGIFELTISIDER